MRRHAFDWREMRKTRKQAAHCPVARVWTSDLFVLAESNYAAPVVRVDDVVNLQADARMCAKRTNLAPGQRMHIDAFAIDDIAHRNDIGRIALDAAEPPDATGFKQRARLVRTCRSEHNIPY